MTSSTKLHFVVTADVTDEGALDPITMLNGLREGVAIARREWLLTTIDDETTLVHSVAVQRAPSVAEAVLLMLGDRVDQTPEALAAVTNAIEAISADFSATRSKFLTQEERELLIKGIASARATDEANEPGFIHSASKYGLRPLLDADDLHLVELAFISDMCLDEFGMDDFIKAITLLDTKPEILSFIGRADADAFEALAESLSFTIEDAEPKVKHQAMPMIERILASIEALTSADEEKTTSGVPSL